VAIPAQELVGSRRVRIERKFGDVGTALRALPVSMKHFLLETAAVILIKIHFADCSPRPFLRESDKMNGHFLLYSL
jgi:hypothetical protein